MYTTIHYVDIWVRCGNCGMDFGIKVQNTKRHNSECIRCKHKMQVFSSISILDIGDN